MIDSHTPIDRATLMERFWRMSPSLQFPPRDEKYISQAEAAAALGVGQTTVGWRIDHGTIPVITEIVKSRRRIVRASFDAWMAETAAKAA